MVVTGKLDRGQLILVGAITIAFIVLGLVVVVNGVLYTQVIDSGNTIESATDAENAELEVTRGVRGLIQEVNRNHDGSDLDGDVNGNLSSLDRAYRNATADSRPAIANVSRDESASIEEGTMIYSDDISGVATNDVFLTNSTLGQFIVTFDTGADGSFEGNFTNGSSVDFTIDSGQDEIAVTVDGGATCRIAASGDEVTVDLLAGRVDGTTDDCLHRHVAKNIGGSHGGLAFEDVDQNYGSFEVVIDGNSVGGTVNYETKPIAWSVPVTVSYDATEISYDRDREIEIYGGNYD